MLSLLLILIIILPLCFGITSNSSKNITISDKEVNVYYNSLDSKENVKLKFYDKEQEIPYINISDAMRIRQSLFDSSITYETKGKSTYKIENTSSKYTVTFNNRGTVIFNITNQSISIDNLALVQAYSYNDTVYDILCKDTTDNEKINYVTHQKKSNGSLKAYSYLGHSMNIYLGGYNIPIYGDSSSLYIPLDLFNNFFVSYSYNLFSYNGDDIYVLPFINAPTEAYLNSYYSGSNSNKERSDKLAEFSYYSLLLNLDYQYGLSDLHGFTSFNKEFEDTKISSLLKSKDNIEYTSGLFNMIYNTFGDAHCSFAKRSVYIKQDVVTQVNKSFNNANIGITELYDNLSKIESARAKIGETNPDYLKCYYEDGDTAYVRFDHFDTFSKVPDYYSIETNGSETDTFGVINYANKMIKANSNIKNVVIDLSTNYGGEEIALVFALGWILGDDARISVNNPITSTNSTIYYNADINLDGKYDVNDDTLEGYNKFVLTSKHSYSCGNALPCICKESQKVKIIGQTSGGGTCQVFPIITTDGTIINISGGARLSNETNSHYSDIDGGATPDYVITSLENIVDRSYTTKVVHSLVL